jgi:single-stranded-DNA-specific exonuclease
MQKHALYALPGIAEKEAFDLQLVMIAALADIMPMKNENRLFVRHGLKSLNEGKARPGLLELAACLDLTRSRVSSVDISWKLCPVINAAGRMGNADLAVELFLCDEPAKRSELAKRLTALRAETKQLYADAWEIAHNDAHKSMDDYEQKLSVVFNEKIHRGVSGILAARLVQANNVPAIVITSQPDTPALAVGSMRTTRGIDATAFLTNFADLCVSYGGHTGAGGFCFEKDKTQEFFERLKELSKIIELREIDERLVIDAEIPFEFMNPDLLQKVDGFEPYGNENPELRFLVKKAKIVSADLIGKPEKIHIKLLLQCGKYKWPALYWNAAEHYGNRFSVNDVVDAVFSVSRNYFNGVESAQMVIADIMRIGE